ncbi:MAG: pantetheine-phosphate adenylyltransferase [bacterium]
MNRQRRAVYPGTFDPITNGHLDIIHRALAVFDCVTVAVISNPAKKALLALPERMALIRRVTHGLRGVEVASFDGLLVDFLRTVRGDVVIRGLRAISDFEYEFQMALMNRRLNRHAETVFMMPDEKYTYLSSSLVKEVVRFGGQVRGLVPPPVERVLKEKFRKA